MAKKVSTKEAAGPFAETVEAAPLKKTTKKSNALEATAEHGAITAKPKPVKKTAAKMSVKTAKPRKPRAAAVDPFAAVAANDVAAKQSTTARKTEAVKKKRTPKMEEPTLDVTADLAAVEPAVELSPVFRALAEVKLPDLERENRARLQIQSPTRLYFYWSLKENPWQQLRRVFGDDLGAYTLVVKFVDLNNDIEHIHPCDAEGNWWFAAEPGTAYQAEIGFYATNRPYFRILHSNTVATPHRSPSPRPADEARWTVSATKFAEVLDASGFSRDAFDVALAGDDLRGADHAAHTAFSRFIGNGEYALDSVVPADIRYALAALAAGKKLEELRWQVSEKLFAILQANAERLTPSGAQSAMTEYFETDEADFEAEQSGPAVFGASLVHFPRTLKRRTRYAPLSSHSIG